MHAGNPQKYQRRTITIKTSSTIKQRYSTNLSQISKKWGAITLVILEPVYIQYLKYFSLSMKKLLNWCCPLYQHTEPESHERSHSTHNKGLSDQLAGLLTNETGYAGTSQAEDANSIDNKMSNEGTTSGLLLMNNQTMHKNQGENRLAYEVSRSSSPKSDKKQQGSSLRKLSQGSEVQPSTTGKLLKEAFSKGIPPNFDYHSTKIQDKNLLRNQSKCKPNWKKPTKNVSNSYRNPKTHSHLWSEQLRTDFLYFNYSQNPEQYSYMSYRLIKNHQIRPCFNDSFDYFFKKNKENSKITGFIAKPKFMSIKMKTLSKHVICNKQSSVGLHEKSDNILIVMSYGRPPAVLSNQVRSSLIIIDNLKAIKADKIQQIYISLENMSKVDEVKSFLYDSGYEAVHQTGGINVRGLGWENMKKVTYFFHMSFGVAEISQILFPLYREFAEEHKLEQLAKDLTFDIQLYNGNFFDDSVVVVKNRSNEAKKFNSFYDNLKIPFAIFETTENIQNYYPYQKFFNQVKGAKLRDFLTLKLLYSQEETSFLQQFQSVKRKCSLRGRRFDNLFKKYEKIQATECEGSGGFYYMLNDSLRSNLRKLFKIDREDFKIDPDTPVQRQWDDNLRAEDFKTIRSGGGNRKDLDYLNEKELNKVQICLSILDDSEQQQYNKGKIKFYPAQNSYQRLDGSQYRIETILEEQGELSLIQVSQISAQQ